MTKRSNSVRSGSYEDWLVETLKDPAEAAAYLTACLEEGEPKVFLLALNDVAKAYGGILSLSRRTKLGRVNLYRILSKTGNPELRSLERILDVLGFRLAIETKSAKKRAA